LAFQPELLYASQGTKFEFTEGGTLGGFKNENIYKTGYINIPLLAKFYATEKLFLVAGPQIGFLLNAKSSGTITGSGVIGGITNTSTVDIPEEDNKDYYNSIDFGLGFGGGYFLTDSLFAEARYNIGLSNNHKQKDVSIAGFVVNKDELVAKSSSIQIAVGYRF
jgi:hypothetical protein